MNRHVWVLLHRWAGLYMAFFLVVAGLTGSVIAFYEPLDAWLNPHKYAARAQGPRLDPVALFDKARALAPPQVSLDSLALQARPGHLVGFLAEARIDPATGEPFGNVPRELMLDPSTGELVHVRMAETPVWPIDRSNVLDVAYRLHYSLALPGTIGTWLFGMAAIVWTLDCFIGLYLTLPLRRRGGGSAAAPQRSWLARWKPAWLMRWRAGGYKFSFDLHRAGGLWVWLMLLVLAWSSVGLNLYEPVYKPVMAALFDMERTGDTLPKRGQQLTEPRLGWRDALARARLLAHEQAASERFQLGREVDMTLDREHGVYAYRFESSSDIGTGGSMLYLDADTGALRALALPDRQKLGPWLTEWLFSLHTAQLWGLPMKVFICMMGLMVVMFSVTGVVIWWVKRKGRLKAAKLIGAERLTPAAYLPWRSQGIRAMRIFGAVQRLANSSSRNG